MAEKKVEECFSIRQMIIRVICWSRPFNSMFAVLLWDNMVELSVEFIDETTFSTVLYKKNGSLNPDHIVRMHAILMNIKSFEYHSWPCHPEIAPG